MKLKNRTAIITGAAKGIGRACAERLAAEGAEVILADIDDATGTAAASALGSKARYLHCDVGDATDVARMIGDAVSSQSTSSSTMPASRHWETSSKSPKPISTA